VTIATRREGQNSTPGSRAMPGLDPKRPFRRWLGVACLGINRTISRRGLLWSRVCATWGRGGLARWASPENWRRSFAGFGLREPARRRWPASLLGAAAGAAGNEICKNQRSRPVRTAATSEVHT